MEKSEPSKEIICMDERIDRSIKAINSQVEKFFQIITDWENFAEVEEFVNEKRQAFVDALNNARQSLNELAEKYGSENQPISRMNNDILHYLYIEFFSLSVCPKLQAIVIFEAYTEGNKNAKSLRSYLQRCGFARVPKVGKSMQILEFFFDIILLFLGKIMILRSVHFLTFL
jgi:hypothetical protein